MRMAIPVTENENLKSKIFAHFGSAPLFLIYDTDTRLSEVVQNSDSGHEHGTCQPMGQLQDKKIDGVVCAGMGMRAVQKFNEAGIKVYKVDSLDRTVKDVSELWLAGQLAEMTVENACRQRHCH